MQRNKHALLLFISFLSLYSCQEKDTYHTSRLPILGERDVDYKTINGEEIVDTLYKLIPDFNYINQDSTWTSSKSLQGQILITDFFFTHCPSICPPMTANMKILNDATQDLKEHVTFLSFSIDPERDTPTRLRWYKKQKSITSNNWIFLTGDEDATHLLAKEFFTGAERNAKIAGGFGHTDNFSLVDTHGHVRGIYRGTDPKEIERLENDLRELLKVEYGIE